MTVAWPLDADPPNDESIARLEQQMAALRDALCVDCRQTLCGHESLFNVAMGLSTVPRCLRACRRAWPGQPRNFATSCWPISGTATVTGKSGNA